MIEESSLEIPYRFESVEVLLKAKKANLLGLGDGYQKMIEVAERGKLRFPTAFKKAQKMVKKDFYILKQEKIREEKLDRIIIANLNLVNNFSLIEERIPWVKQIASHESLFQFLGQFSTDVQRHCGILPFPGSYTAKFEAILKIKHFLRREILVHMSARKGNLLSSVEEIKKALVAYAVFASGDNDVLTALRIADEHNSGDVLYQNACAEILFTRIPSVLREISLIDPQTIRQKLFSKLTRIGLSAHQKMALFGYFRGNIRREELLPTLDRISSIAQQMLRNEDGRKLHHYICAIRKKIEDSRKLCEQLFLSPELSEMQKMHRPRNVLRSKISYKESLINTYTLVTSLQFYPTKDYLDLIKGEASDDCTKTIDLAEKQLRTPQFFNIRIFQNSNWIGNIYMLDFTREYGVLLLDRIQIPRGINADYINFFDHLKDIFQKMFLNLKHKKVLMPLTISNHWTLQKVFNNYRKDLTGEYLAFPAEYARPFECLRETNFVVLYRKE